MTMHVLLSSYSDFIHSIVLVDLAKEDSDQHANRETVERVSRLTEIEDLQALNGPPVAPLCIKVLRLCVLCFACLELFIVDVDDYLIPGSAGLF